MRWRPWWMILLGLAAATWQTPAVAAPRVVASILPLQSLAAAIMAGVGTPELLVPGGASPETYALRPQDAGKLDGADVILWDGPRLEAFLINPLRNLGSRAQVLEAMTAPGVKLVDASRSRHLAIGGTAIDDDGPKDPHVWLDPDNAAAIGRDLAATLSRLDPRDAARYTANAQALARRLHALDEHLAAQLRPLAGRSFIVFHDAYNYPARRYGLNVAGVVTYNPATAPGPRHLARLRDLIDQAKVVCLFREPEFEPKLVRMLAGGRPVKIGVLDPLGAAFRPGPDQYFQMWKANAQALTACLGGGGAGGLDSGVRR